MSNPEEKLCFVIRPFHSPYNERHNNIFKPAIEGAGLEARLAGSPGVSEITKDIEESIRNAHVCFADVSEDNLNVWYEVGFAFACYRKIAMVCNTGERELNKLPFDVKTKKVIPYSQSVDSDTQDAAQLQKEITEHIRELSKTAPPLAPQPSVKDNTPIIPDDLTLKDLEILCKIMKHCSIQRQSMPSRFLKEGRRNPLDVDISIQKLRIKGYIVLQSFMTRGDEYKSTNKALKFFENNRELFDEQGSPLHIQ